MFLKITGDKINGYGVIEASFLSIFALISFLSFACEQIFTKN